MGNLLLSLHLILFVFFGQKPAVANSSIQEIFGLETLSSGRVLCEDLSDRFCETLWSAENLGNFTFPNGAKILKGSARQDVISNQELIYWQKLIEKKCSLPEDLRQALEMDCSGSGGEDLLSQLEAHFLTLPSINDSTAESRPWRLTASDFFRDFRRKITDVAYQRAFRRLPELRGKASADFTYAEEQVFSEGKFDIEAEIMDAVYLNDEAWLRAVDLFHQAKSDILQVLDNLEIDEENLQRMKKKVSQTQISLPYTDPRRADAEEDCATTEDNAYYRLARNQLVICIGKLNIIGGSGGLYGTIAHEIGHAIDPGTFSQDVIWQSDLARLNAKVYQSNASLDCEAWQHSKEKFYQPSETFFALPENVERLSQCLVDRSRLDEITPASLQFASQREAEDGIDGYARREVFTFLTEPMTLRQGALVENEVFLNPLLFASSGNSYLPDPYFNTGEFHRGTMFIQEYKCQLAQEHLTEEQAFENSINETQRLAQIFNYNEYAVMMQNSTVLVSYNQARRVGEDYADWISHQALRLYLERQESLENRRTAVLSRMVTFCEAGGIEVLAAEKVRIESFFSRAAHPIDRRRRLRIMTPAISELIECERGQELQDLDQGCDATIIRQQVRD